MTEDIRRIRLRVPFSASVFVRGAKRARDVVCLVETAADLPVLRRAVRTVSEATPRPALPGLTDEKRAQQLDASAREEMKRIAAKRAAEEEPSTSSFSEEQARVEDCD